MTDVTQMIEGLRAQVRAMPATRRLGRVTGVTGLIIESEGPNVGLGELCKIRSERGDFDTLAEVVGFRGQHVLLMPLGETTGLHAGAEVMACDLPPLPVPGPQLLGRVLDALGRPMDGLGPLVTRRGDVTSAKPPHPLRRRRIKESFVTGVRAIDAFIPLGRGQRVGLFAGSGVGKSTLLSMIARGAEADIVVVGLVGERGRELREFLEKDLGEEGLRRSVIVCSTSDTPAPLRMRAAYTATAIAEAYRDQGANVLLLMDSVTRFAMAQREIGLAVGEPPATRGYTPSVFAKLPGLLERAGSGEVGTITALYTVLVEGDDMNEPVADAVRGILDGHIVLSRALAHANHFPAIDVLESVSRLVNDVCTPAEAAQAGRAREHLAVYRKNEDLITIGAYQRGNNPALDQAVALHDPLKAFLRQPTTERIVREATYTALGKIVG